jgi:hypothetical protein
MAVVRGRLSRRKTEKKVASIRGEILTRQWQFSPWLAAAIRGRRQRIPDRGLSGSHAVGACGMELPVTYQE